MSLPLVNYSSSSESESEIEKIKYIKTKRLKFESPSLSNNEDVLKSKFEQDNLKELHQGRIRSFDHERGNWATFLYIPVNFQLLDDIQESIKSLFNTQINLVSSTNIHISMTKTVILQHHWIQSFVLSLKNSLSDINKFKTNFGDVNIYCNEEETRTFVGLSISPLFVKKLKAIIEKLDIILKEFKLEPFYSNPSFHISILWCVGDHREFLLNNLSKIQAKVNEYLLREPEEFELYVTKLLCKSGCKTFSFDLQ